LEIKNVSKVFHTKDKDVEAIRNVSFNVKEGEFISIIGASGCGKTTLLRLIAGLEKNYGGNILLDGKKVEKAGLDRGVIFQEHRLLPWLTVEENLTIGLDGTKKELQDLAREYLKKVDLENFEKVYPSQLSGGMAQRVAIARALMRRPRILLLDEPLGALDALTRMNMQAEIDRIREEEKTTMIMVTHDIDEAIFLGDKVVVMKPRPAEVDQIISIKIPRPRLRNSEDFAFYRNTITNMFNHSIMDYAI
ncbi:MAG: ABC transporter ATP-binding protein, partial [Lachnospiraceae bacterium]|nr:ABC transporter ATP-binding protein [Lachnospiraceae bacterium]